ncbi:MAG: asparagine synthase (glutamine-hydrolyzing) [Rhizobiaceae bacterium]
MCGIAGILASSDPADERRIGQMVDIQSHRGPNGDAIFQSPGAWFGHGRLSIIDLDSRAAQPMVSEDGRFVLVFNGAIYNYKELRDELGMLGYRFTTDSDTEVLLIAMAHWGEQALSRLIGMFAFCFYDAQTRQALLARDPFGQKPLNFVQKSSGPVYFSSEIKALLAAGVEAKPNKTVWSRYLLHARYDDSRETVFSGIEQLLPGELMRVSADGKLQRHKWYELFDRVEHRANATAETAKDQLRELLANAAKIHMRADVPVGVSLSGGLDSSALLACLEMAGVLPQDLKCISVEFSDAFSESDWMNAAARHHGLGTEIFTFSRNDFLDSLAPTMWHLEAPIGGLMNCALGEVMAQAKHSGLRVMHDGTGLDEAFGGYRNHHNLYLGLELRKGSANADRQLKEYAANWDVTIQQARVVGESALGAKSAAIDGTIPIREELISGELKSLDGELYSIPSLGDPLKDAFATYLHVEKIPRNTRMKDRISMAHGIELRLPFLDHRLVEFGLSLPPELMFLYGRSKSIIREALAGTMNDEVRLAKKRSIQAPQGIWLQEDPMKNFVGDIIHSRSFAERGFFDATACIKAFERFCTGADANSFFVWQWINAELWFQTFVDQDAVQNQTRFR